MTIFKSLITAIAIAAGIGGMQAQDFPSKPITLLVGFAPGGAVDIVARALGAQLQEQIGQTVVIENRPGAGSNIAAVAAARAPADGYTLLVGANGMTTNMKLYANAGFDVQKEFAGVSLIGETPPVIAAGKGFSGDSLKDLVAQAKAKPGALSYGSPGGGTSAHLMMELFQRAAGIQLQHVPYRGGAPAINDAVGGHVPLLAVNFPEVIGQTNAGTLKVLGVPSLQRSPLLPNAPTVAEQGFAGFEASTWWALFAPINTPRAVVDRLSAEVRKAAATQAFKDRMAQIGAVATGSTPQQMDAFIARERELWEKIIVESKITAE